jgi:hypothetical protein
MFFRYKPAFYAAFKRALASKAPASRYPQLEAWLRQTLPLVDAVFLAADMQTFDEAARRALILHVDKRDISVQTILSAIRHHAAQEYPYMLNNKHDHDFMVMYATNLNDRYLMMRLGETEPAQAKPLKSAVATLRDHLDRMPSQPG